MANTLKIKKETIVKIKPMMNRIVTTADVYTQKECYSPSGLLLSDQVGKIKQIQKVIAVGPVVRNIEVGDYVFLDFTPFEQKKYSKDINNIRIIVNIIVLFILLLSMQDNNKN